MTSSNRVCRVGILGATGLVGRALIRQIRDDPTMEIAWLGASQAHVGTEGNALVEEGGNSLPRLEPLLPVPRKASSLDFVFSALPKNVAFEIEPEWARETIVISNASAYRMDPMVPLVVPEVNASHIVPLIRRQRKERNWRGLVTNPNCATIPLVIALAPWRDLGLKSVCVSTYQALSGAGRDGPSALDALDNVIPNICGEDEKLETEPMKILGDHDRPMSSVQISASTARVPVRHGHLLHARVRFDKPAMTSGLLARWRESMGLDVSAECSVPLKVLDKPPEPRILKPMDLTVYVGGLEPDPIFHVRFWALADNLARGAAGAAWLNAHAVRRRFEQFDD